MSLFAFKMPKAIHDLAQELIADPKFYPDKTPEEREKIAWATANSRLASSIESNVIEFIGSQEPTYSMVQGSDGASMLVFRNARLARAEVNANRDEISPEGIKELAASIAGWPIDIEHGKRLICGTILAGRPQDLDLLVDGVVWAERFKKEADDIQSGVAKLSVEARADKAKCSICGNEFLSAGLYCDHLRDRNHSNAVRKLSGLKGRGAAITHRPAGTDTGFDPNQIYLIASHEEKVVAVAASGGSNKQESDMELEQQVKDLQAKLDAAIQEAAAKDKLLADANKVVTELTAAQQASEKRNLELIAVVRRAKLAGLSDEEWSQQKDSLLKLPDDLFDLMASKLAAPAKTPEAPKQPAQPIVSGNGSAARIVLG